MDHLSVSQINLYLLCGLKYKFQYIDNLPRPFRSSALVMGSAFHSTLAYYHQQKKDGNDVSHETLYRIFDSDWYAQTIDTEIRYKEREQELTLKSQGKEFLNLYTLDFKGEVEAYEVPFRIPIILSSNGTQHTIPFEGFIDLVETHDTLVEFKTSGQTMSAHDVHTHLQLTAYSYVYQTLHRKLPQKIKLINFVKGRKPKMVTFETKREQQDFEAFLYVVRKVVEGIQSEVFIPHQGYWCKDCEYASHCPLGANLKRIAS
ncbi:MAG: PD-(D/E)XK nuclease family protein [Melioribacteraceae bacterium]|nr:PD-(D/E)XK nuclease family protein [Melioribacteraceae bacterium]